MEAAITAPVFLTFVFLFILLIRIVAIEIALQSVATNTVKQLSGAWVPFEKQLEQGGAWMDKLDPGNWGFIPEPVRPLLESMSQWRSLPEDALEHALAVGLKPAVWANVPDEWRGTLLLKDRLTVEQVAIPHVIGERQHFGLQIRYRVVFALPFFKKEIQIRKSASERVWFGE